MTWLVIIFGLLVIISPLFWVRSTPQERKKEAMRSLARQAGIRVGLQKRPDAREDETRIEAVCYRLLWRLKRPDQFWVLHRFSDRGWESGISGWQLLNGELDDFLIAKLGSLVEKLPETVSAVICDSAGIGLVWKETDDKATFEVIREILHNLQDYLEKKHPTLDQ